MGPQTQIRWPDANAPDAPATVDDTRAAREDGIDRAEQGAGVEWIARAVEAIRRVALSKQTFTTDDLWRYVDFPEQPRAMGAAIRQARKRGLCEPTDRTMPSTRMRTATGSRFHQRALCVWRSLIFQG